MVEDASAGWPLPAPPSWTPPPTPPGPPAPPPGWGVQGAPPGPSLPRTNGLAVAALVMGCVSFLLCLVPSILAVVFGYVSKGQIDRSGGAQTGRGLAVAGIVLGWVGIGFALLVAIAFVILVATGSSTSGDTHTGTETLRAVARMALLA